MTYRGFRTRAQIGLRAPRSRSTNIDASRGGTVRHHAGSAQNVSPHVSGHSRCESLWRGFQRYHMDSKGWVDIAYTAGVCQHGFVLAGRGAGVRTAANGTDAANGSYYAICWIGGGSEQPTQDAIDAFWAAHEMLRRDGGAGDRVRDHSDFRSTGCPGNFTGFARTNPTSPTEEDDMPTAAEIASAVWAAGVGRGDSRRTLAEVVVQAAADAAAARALAERAAAGDTLTDDQITEIIRDAARHVRVSVRVEEDDA